MTKKELIEKLQASLAKNKVQLSQTDTNKVFDAVFDTVAAAAVKSGKLTILGFGTFAVRKRAARKGINPATKQAIKIPAKKVLSFKASKAIKIK